MRKKNYLILFLVFVLVMTLVTLLGENGLLHAFRLKRELGKLTRVNQSIRLENAALLEEITYLRDHKGYLELQAHRQGLVKEGEVVFQFRGEP
jgi:cell division protein FtsB